MVDVTVYVKGNHFFFSFLYAGLERLQKKRFCSVRYIYPWNKEFRPSESDMLLSLNVADGADIKKRICFDLSDFSNTIYQEALVFHDFYFKRNYFAKNYIHLPEQLRKKILPFGLVFACKYNYGFRAFLNLLAGFSPNKSEKIRFKTKVGQWYNYLKFPDILDYESRSTLSETGTILFQTRAWNPHNHEYWQAVNESRLQVINALKAHFKERFIGGFVPDRFSRRHYPDAITSFKTSRIDYIQLVQKASICVYTHGLFHSPAFKLGEYLASGRCVVAEPLVNELPMPLIDGHHFLSFATADECVAKCELLLQNKSMINQMMHRNSVFYQEYVEPSRQLARAIEIAMAE